MVIKKAENENMAAFLIVVWWALFLFISLFVGVKVLADKKSDRESWAYPYGVIATVHVDSLHLSDFRENPKVEESGVLESQKRLKELELTTIRKIISQHTTEMQLELEKCAGEKRDLDTGLKNGGSLFVFFLKTQIDVTGRTGEISVQNQGLNIPLKHCIARMIVGVQSMDFPARLMGTVIDLAMQFEIRFLSDEEAMGRGYLYQLAEAQWRKTLETNGPRWRRCEKDADCTLARYNCESEPINIKSIGEFEENALKRLKPPCNEKVAGQDQSTAQNKVRCRNKTCKVVK